MMTCTDIYLHRSLGERFQKMDVIEMNKRLTFLDHANAVAKTQGSCRR